MDLLQHFEKQQIKDVERPSLREGDLVQVETKVTEGEKTRLQTFEGTVLGIRGSGPSTTFTVRRENGRFGVERIFSLYSPLITKIEIVKRQKVRRAKLNYLRESNRRRVKEDVLSMQRHVQEEENKKRLAEEAKKKAEEEAAKAEAEKAKAEKEAAAAKEKEETAEKTEEESSKESK